MDARPRNGHRAGLIAGGILVLGLLLAAMGALAWQASARRDHAQSFQTAATEVSATVDTLLRRDTDFVGTLSAILTVQPDPSQSDFTSMYTGLEGWERQVGGLGTTVVRVVPAARLSAFLARRNAEPRFRDLAGQVIQPVPIDGRSRYCLVSAGESIVGVLTPQFAREVQGDWCQASSEIGSSQVPIQHLVAETGGMVIAPAEAEGVSTLIFVQAFYPPDALVSTAAQRSAAVNGWVVSSFDISSLLSTALAGHPGLGLSLYHSNSGLSRELVAYRGAASTHGGYSSTSIADIQGPWTVRVQGNIASGGPSPSLQGLLVFAIGVLVTLLTAALVLVLTRSRERALGMVQEKTGQLRHLALHDALTGLPNRVLALDRAEQMLARARRQNIPVAALYVDLDGFKAVNDTFGHAAGDELLCMVAARLSGVIREGDTAARLSGDEFVVLVEGSTLDAGPELVAERLLEVLRRPYEMTGAVGRALTLTASIGVCLGEHSTAEELLRDADLALYEAKEHGRDGYALFESRMQTASQDRLTLEMDLVDALELQQLRILYQPTFDLQSEAISGVEALICWEHPTRGSVSPSEFLPIAERSGLIMPIGRWALEEACRQAAIWRCDGHELGVAVNICAPQLESGELAADVSDALRAAGLDAGLLTLEVAEATIMRDAETTAERLRALKRLGVRIAIDQFGTGYSSLAYLRRFPADALKVDSAFISEIAGSQDATALIETIVQLGRTLHMETLAEGIEENGRLHRHQREHCDRGHGFLFARPLTPEAFEVFLKTLPRRRAPLSTL